MSDARGFTLIETAVAMTLVLLVLLGAAVMTLTSVSQLERSGEQTTAVTLAQQRVEWLRNQGYTASALNAGTSTETLSGTYTGYTRVTTVQDATPRTNVKQITVLTTTPSGRTAQVVALVEKGV